MEAKFFEVTQFQNIQTVSPIYVPIFGNNYSREDSDTTITVRSLYKQYLTKEWVRNMDLRVQVHPGELWVSKQRVHIVLEASKSAGAKGGVPKIFGFVHPLHPF